MNDPFYQAFLAGVAQGIRDAGYCEVCTDHPASVTVFSRNDIVRVCRACFEAGWERNEKNLAPWQAEFDAA